MTRPPITLLCILDGLGLNPNPKANAVALARKPTIDNLMVSSPWTTLTTHGTRVGLPEGHMGNSEVGHLNIGAGRVVEQWLYRISKEFKNGFLKKNPLFGEFIDGIPAKGAIHLIGLYSSGGVHSDSSHLFELLEELLRRGKERIIVHPILDGRDTAPTVGKSDMEKLIAYVTRHPQIQIGSVSGRFFAMDRDKRWERTEKAYTVIAKGLGERATNPVSYISDCYQKGVTDEFIEPVTVTPTPVSPNDGVIFFNFRADRMRQLVAAFTQPDFNSFNRNHPPLQSNQALCMTEYDVRFGLPYLFENTPIDNHLGQVVSSANLKQLRTAETEKYPHVTYFLNGLDEILLLGEAREMVPSPRDVKTYDLKPEMSAAGVEAIVINAINKDLYDLIVVNFANCDMVGHTGVLEAAIKAVETVDGCLGRILEALKAKNGQALIIADHGNAEQMIDYETGAPHTSHTTYPVPAILFGRSDVEKLRQGGALCDVAPTILKLMDLPQPKEMTGLPLF